MMDSKIKTGLKIGGAIVFFGLILLFIVRYTTKSHSPEDTVVYEANNLKLEVFYNRPYRKDRKIFGNKVPYNEVWRTGANEATTFETTAPVLVDGSLLAAGKYTLWTIPMENSWKVIFNTKMYPWGINLDKVAYREADFDALVLERPVEKTSHNVEQFTISFQEAGEFINMKLAWDNTIINVPIKKEEAPLGASVNQ